MNQDIITALYQSWFNMLTSISEGELNNWYKLMFSEDPECHNLATEIFNSFGDSNFCYRAIMNCLDPNWLYRSFNMDNYILEIPATMGYTIREVQHVMNFPDELKNIAEMNLSSDPEINYWERNY